MTDAPRPPGAQADRRLMARLALGVPLSDHPFAELGRACGLGEDEVIERLRWLLGHGVLTHLGPLPPAGDGAALLADEAQRRFDQRLLDATASGLPLVRRPYEALGAMLGVPGEAVIERLQGMLGAGLLTQIGVLPAQPPAARDAT